MYSENKLVAFSCVLLREENNSLNADYESIILPIKK